MTEYFNLNILVVDDSASQRLQLQAALGERGCLVQAVGDSKRALEQLEAYKPDLMILDLMMPGVDGLELLRLLRGQPNVADIPVIIITAQTLDPVKRANVEREMNVKRILVKPADPGLLYEAVRQVSKSKGKYTQGLS